MKGKSTRVRILILLVTLAVLALAIPFSGVMADPSLAPAPPSVSANEKAVPSPESVFGFKPGTDYKLVNYPEAVAYFKKVSETSSRVKFQVVGKTSGTENFAPEGAFPPQDMVMAIISDKQNLDKLDAYKAIQQKLANPRSLAPGEAEKLIPQALPIVLVAASQHASEIGGTQMELNLLYELATSDAPDVQEILKNTILLLLPSQNPDGMRMEVEWYKKYLAEHPDWAGGGVPWLYQKYTGHDDNRDWFMFNLAENQATGRQLYQEWFPNVTYDIHQMGASGMRLFVPPFTDPVNPEIDPLVIREISLVGDTAVADLQAAGLPGVGTNAIYDTWWHGGMRSAPYYHNMIGLLTEAASTNLASPIYQKNADIKGSARGVANNRQAYNNYPDPYFPDESKNPNWTLGDIVKYEHIATKGFLKAAARNREFLERNFYNLNVKAIELGDPNSGRFEAPFAMVLPADQQRDPATTAKLVNTMIFTGNEVHQATKPFVADGQTYPAGSYVFLMSQPFRQNLTGTLGIQTYPPRFNADGSPEAPYDVAGWTLWMQMGTPLVEVKGSFDTGSLVSVKEAAVPAGTVTGPGSMYAFGDEMNNAAVVRFKLLDAGYTLKWAMAGFKDGGKDFNAGTTIVSGGDQAKLPNLLASMAKELGVSFNALASEPTVTLKKLTKPRIAVYETFSQNADSGWFRLLLDNYGIPYTILHNPKNQPDIWKNLAGSFDVIVLSDVSSSALLNGNSVGSLPPDYTEGIGTAGADALKAFVNGGGTLLTMGNGTQFPILETAKGGMGLPVANALQGVDRKEFYCPGSLLQTEIDDPSSPVAFGYNAKPGDKLDVYFSSSQAFTVSDPNVVKTIISYPDTGNLMRSGWLLDTKDRLHGKAAAVEAQVGSGKVVMIGFKDHWRGQSWNNLKLSFNSFFYATAK